MLGFNGGRLGSKNVIEQNGILVPSPDANFDDVMLLLNGNGSNGSTDITDSSDSSQTITLSGNTQISTAQSKFGGSSIYFDGNGDFLQPPNDSNSFSFGTGNFTLECWIYPTGQGTTSVGNLFSQRSNNNGISWRYVVASEETQFFYGEGIGGFNSGTGSVPLNTWTHVALTRSGNTFTLWVGGQSGGTNTITASMGYARPRIGTSIAYPNEYYKGYIDDFRITKGLARYTASFTPPTAQFEPRVRGFKASGVWTIPEVSRLRRTAVWPGTNSIVPDGLVLNLDAGDTNSYSGTGTIWTDLSGNGNDSTLSNGPTFSSADGGSIVTDGSNDRVDVPTNFFSFPSITAFTIEMWFKSTQTNGGTMFGQQNSSYDPTSVSGFVPVIYLKSNGQIRVEPFWTGSNTNYINSTSTSLNDGNWHNVITTFNSGTNKLYIDGVYDTQQTGLTLTNYTTTYYYIIGAGRNDGRSLGSKYFSGNTSIFRFYENELTTSEVQKNYNAVKGRYGL